LISLAMVAVVAQLSPSQAIAQTVSGSIVGTVKDPDGLSIAGGTDRCLCSRQL